MTHERVPRVQRWSGKFSPTLLIPSEMSPALILTLGMLSVLQPAVLAVNPRCFRRIVIILVLVIALVVVTRMPIPELPELPIPLVM